MTGPMPTPPTPTPIARKRDRQAALAEIIETSPDGILVVDPEGRMALYNRRFTAIWGIPEEIARTRSDDRAIQSVLDKIEDPEGFVARVRWLYEHPDETAVEDIRLRDGRVLERHTSPLRDATGARYGRIWYFRDVTERLRAQRELQRRTEELALFVAAASHDLRSPLRSIESFGGMLAAEARLDARGKDLVGRMRAASARADQLIDALVEYVRVDEKNVPPEDVDLDAVLREARANLSETIRASHAEIEAGPLPVARAHRRLVRQVFLHLLSNALKFHRPGTPPTIRVEGARDGRFAKVSFRDDGIGFEPHQAESILRPFHRLHSRAHYEGAGLGLALCAHIAERYGGRLEAYGRPDEGATFTVYLPV